MTASENKANVVSIEWKDPKKELPKAGTYALVAFSWGCCSEDYDIFYFDGKDWHDNYGCAFNVLGWAYIPTIPENWINNHNKNQK